MVGTSHIPLSVRRLMMITLLSFTIRRLYLDKMAMHFSSHSLPMERRDPVCKISNSYTCCDTGESVDESGTVP